MTMMLLRERKAIIETLLLIMISTKDRWRQDGKSHQWNGKEPESYVSVMCKRKRRCRGMMPERRARIEDKANNNHAKGNGGNQGNPKLAIDLIRVM